MKLKPSHINTFCRWWGKIAGREVDYVTFFDHALRWKYQKYQPDEQKRLLFICVAFDKSGYIPDFAEEYWNKRVLPFLVIGGRNATR